MKNQQTNMVEMIDWAVGDAPLAGTAFAGTGLAAAIGNFDGIHVGHQKVLKEAKQKAKKKNLPLGELTFKQVP